MKIIFYFLALSIGLLDTAYAIFDLKSVDSASYMENLRRFSGRKIHSIEFSEQQNIPTVLKQKFTALKDRPLRFEDLHQIVQWFHDSLGDSRLELYLRERENDVVLVVSFQERPKVKAVEFEGAHYFSSSTLKAMIDLKEGSDLDPVALENSVEKILSLYRAQGFFSIQVTPFYDKKQILQFKINEGNSTIIGKVTVSPIQSVEDKLVRKRLENSLLDAFDLVSGNRLEKEKLNQGLLNIKTWLRDYDFLVAKDPVLESHIGADGRMNIRVNIDYGARIRFGFRGNKLFSYRELMYHVREIKELSSGVDYIEAVRRKISDLYKDAGYANASINTVVRENPEKGIKNISLIISEGEKIRISRLNIEGIYSMPQEEAVDLFFSFASRLNQRGFFQEAGLNKAAELLADHLRSKGFLLAKLEFTKFNFRPDRKEVAVTLLYNEGVQTKVQNIEINGAKNFKQEDAVKILGVKIGEPFNIFNFEKGLALLKDQYQDLGYLSMRIANEGSDTIVQYNSDQTLVNLRLDLEEGPLIHVGEIIVRGNSQTHARVILRELPFIEKDILTRPLLREAEDNLRKLNLFGSVIVRPIERPGEENVRDILVLIEETIPGSIELTPGFRTDLGVRLGFDASYQNLGGWNRGISSSFVLNRRVEKGMYRFLEYQASLGFREPYFANWPVTLTTNLDFLRRQFVHFDANISKVTAGFRRDLSRHLTGLLEYSYERNDIRNVQKPYSKETDEKISFIGAITPGIVFDSRSDKFNPTSGILSSSRVEVASRFWGSETKIGYYKASTNNSAYINIFDDVVWAFAMNFGYERSNVPNEPIPIFKLFRLGGVGSVRAYSIDSIQVETAKVIKGTLAMYNYRSELRVPLMGSLGGALFFDAGNLSVDRIIPFKLRNSVGAGLRYNTAVGPVALDFAWKLESDRTIGDTTVDEDGRFRIGFSIGSF